MAATVSLSLSKTIDKYFTKTKKGSLDSVEKPNLPANSENSDSEFEMIHGKSRIIKNSSNNIGLNTDSSKSNDDTDFENNELKLLQTTELQRNISPITKELLSSKPRKKSKSPLKSKGRADKISASSTELSEDSDVGEHQHATAKTHSFSSHSSTNLNQGTNSSKEVSGLRKKKDHEISDEEFIPDTQQTPMPLQFDLNAGKRIIEGKNPTNVNSDDSKNSDLEESSPNDCENPIVSKPQNVTTGDSQSWLEQLKSKLKCIDQPNKGSELNSLNFENVTEDVECFLVQCPKEIEPKSFSNKDIALDRISSISLKKQGNLTSYECVTNRINEERLVDVILPKGNQSGGQLGRLRLVGNIILTESINLPKLVKPEISPPKRVEYPDRFAEMCLSLPVADSSSGDSRCASFSRDRSDRKGKKKIKREGSDQEQYFGTFNDSGVDILFSSLMKRKKKKKIKDPELNTSLDEEFLAADDILKSESSYENLETLVKKKRKKKSTVSETGTAVFEVKQERVGDSEVVRGDEYNYNPKIKPQPVDSPELALHTIKKKKKNKRKDEDSLWH